MNSYKDGEFELRSNDPEANAAMYRSLEVMMTPSDVSFSRWKGDDLMGVCLYQGYTRCSLITHIAGFMPNWVSRDFIWVSMHYPFMQLGVERLFGFVNENNKEALNFDMRMGFKIETRIRKVYPDGDQIVLVMERDDCRWLKMKPKAVKSNRG